jgi:hypothetical protein
MEEKGLIEKSSYSFLKNRNLYECYLNTYFNLFGLTMQSLGVQMRKCPEINSGLFLCAQVWEARFEKFVSTKNLSHIVGGAFLFRDYEGGTHNLRVTSAGVPKPSKEI